MAPCSSCRSSARCPRLQSGARLRTHDRCVPLRSRLPSLHQREPRAFAASAGPATSPCRRSTCLIQRDLEDQLFQCRTHSGDAATHARWPVTAQTGDWPWGPKSIVSFTSNRYGTNQIRIGNIGKHACGHGRSQRQNHVLSRVGHEPSGPVFAWLLARRPVLSEVTARPKMGWGSRTCLALTNGLEPVP